MSRDRKWSNRRKRSNRTIRGFMGTVVGELEGCVWEEE